MVELQDKNLSYEQVAETIIEFGNRMLDEDESAEVWEVASGILAGAVQFWLYSRQPCDDPFCQACDDISNAERRLQTLLRETHNLAEESDYYVSAKDVFAGTA
jgi:hypothetical protein